MTVGALGPVPPTLHRAASTGSRLGIGSGRSGRGGAIYGSPGGSGPLIRAIVLVLAVIVLLVLVAKNCTGSDSTADEGFQESVRAGVATIDPAITVEFGADRTVILSGSVGTEQQRLEAAAQAVLAGAEDVENELTVVAGASQTATGAAPAGTLQAAIDEVIAATPIVFASGSAEIAEESTATLDQVAQLIIANPEARVDIIGHTDNQGDPDANLQLSRDRALAVRNYLIDAGVEVLNVNSDGRGDAEPVADNDTDEGRAANRRIEFIVR